ncbi:hypothetical protein GTY65_10690 [Streptomyces sp. SID8379]|uniref:hypothetical protein n=1 Tax=unclassified Streptomyces TaxID=2593676 RepID=UPI00039A491D|nr:MULTISPECIES: hypothetical protein [unclassified Streptomyces]MYW64532.1 hypothetical protein [Streptomyces sp. SID8379]
MTTTRARARARATAGIKGRPPSTAGRTRRIGALLLLASVASMTLCWFTFTTWLPHDRERYRDYRAAETCPARVTVREQRQKDCLVLGRLTVVKAVTDHGGKTPHYEVTLKDRDLWQGEVDFSDPEPLFERLRAGDRVTATVWRRDITALDRDGVVQSTIDAPRDELQMNAAFGLLAALVAAEAAAFGAARLVSPRSHAPFAWDPYGRRLLLTILLACCGVGFPAVWAGTPWWTVPAIVVPVVAGAAVVLYRRGR